MERHALIFSNTDQPSLVGNLVDLGYKVHHYREHAAIKDLILDGSFRREDLCVCIWSNEFDKHGKIDLLTKRRKKTALRATSLFHVETNYDLGALTLDELELIAA